MTETEVERLVVRLVGDGQSYVKMLQDATKSTQDAAKQIEQSTGKIEKMRHSLESLGGTATRVFGAIGIGLSFKAMYDMWDKSDDLITELTTVIKANGHAVDEVLPKYREFAKEMAAVTANSKGTVLSLMKQAEMLGLTGEAAKRAAKNAITLGAMKDADPNSFMRQTVNFEKTGNAAGLARILGLMGEMEEDTTKAAEAAKLLEKNWALVITKGEDGGARIQRSLNSIKELGKEAGAVIGAVFEPTIKYLEQAVKWFQQLNPIVKQAVIAFILLTAAIEPALFALGVMGTRIAFLKVAFVASMTFLGDFALRLWGLSAAFTAMSMRAQIATVAVGGLAGVVALAAVGAYRALTGAIEQSNRALEESDKIASKMAEREVNRQRPVLEQLSKLKSASEREKFSSQFLPDAEKRLNDLRDQKKAAEEALAKADVKTRSLGPFNIQRGVTGLGSGLQSEYEAAKKALEQVEKQVDAQKSYVDQLRSSAQISEQHIKSVSELNDKYKEQAATAGMAQEEIELLDATKKLGSDHFLVAMLRENQELAKFSQATAAANKSAQELVKSLQFEIDTFGMDEDAARLKKLEMEGVDAATIKQIDTLQRQKYMLESVAAAEEWGADMAEKKVEAYKAIDAMRAGSAASRTAVFAYQNRFGDDAKSEQKQTNRLLVDAVDVLQQIRDKEAIQVEEDALA